MATNLKSGISLLNLGNSKVATGINTARNPLTILTKQAQNVGNNTSWVPVGISNLVNQKMETLQHDLKTKEIKRDVIIRVAICLDFTASTSYVVESFRDQSNLLTSAIRDGYPSVRVLPVAFHGPNSSASTGPIDDTSWWKGCQNIGNDRNEPPIVEGLKRIEGNDFFSGQEKPGINFTVIATDEALKKDSGYTQVVEYLRKANSFVIAILSDDENRIVQSYSKDLETDLPGRVFTVCNISNAAKLSADIILGICNQYIEDSVQNSKTLDAQKPIASFDRILQGLSARGHSNMAISWKGETKLLK